MTDYDAIVIGAGNGGLTAAASLAAKGASVLLLEQHNIPGGCATSFCRGRFEFEVALHQLSGIGTPEFAGPVRSILDKLGVTDKLEFVQMEDLYRVEIQDPRLGITLKPDRNEVIADLQKHFPHEKEGIQQYMDFIYQYFPEALGAHFMGDPEASPEKYPTYFKYALKTTGQIMDQYVKDPALQMVLSPYWTYIGLPPRLMPFNEMAAMMVAFCEFKPYHLKGGSQAMSNALADAVLNKGGTIRYNSGVKRILVDSDGVQGVVTEKGEEISAKYVVSNASKVTTYVDMVGPEHIPAAVLGELKQSPLSQSAFVIFMGLDKEPAELGIEASTNFLFGDTDMEKVYQKMRTIDIDEHDGMVFSCYDVADPTFSPAGASQVALVTLKYGEPWMRVPPAAYADTKYRCADAMLDVLDKTYPEVRKHIEEIDVATPFTFMRYLGTPQGTIYGFENLLRTSDQMIPNQPHIKGLYGVGGWVGLPGFQPTLESGVKVASRVIKELNA
jgi:prolycopene isomerase